MLRLGFALRRLGRSCPPCASYGTAAESSALHRMVRVENLPEGYNVGSIIDAMKANPSETIIPSKDHLLVKFFDEKAARRCVEANKELSVKIDDSTSPPLSTLTVASLAKHGASRTIRLGTLPGDFTESRFNEILSQCGLISSRFDRATGVAEAQFLDLNQAFKARIDFLKAGTNPKYLEAEHFTYPEWCSKEDTQPGQRRLVRISGLTDSLIREMCTSWTNDYARFPLAAFISAQFIDGSGEMSVYFPTSALAQQFITTCEPLADGQCQFFLKTSGQVVSPSVVTAIDQGARRTVTVPYSGILTDRVQRQFGRFLSKFGRIDERYITHVDGQLLVPFHSVIGAASFVYLYQRGSKINTLSPVAAEIKGTKPTFVGCHLS
ncbi:hypothetical protein IW261DRAFT_1477974 [Armillaria novae-zelandiae]|uniref:RRM domain-containing protein n=1 Tax=Armillaria novae-zelandiae TaxID=153914 RepID=A0AA39P9F2_9AGAR|nr:hypothetical protein IW261DRAFT_1477974 [Armillaria novae-zelandiae]